MKRRFAQLWHDERGFVVSAELVLVSTILVTGLIVGMTCLQQSVVSEYQDVGAAIGALDQTYQFSGMLGCRRWFCGRSAFTAGSAFFDGRDELPGRWDIGCPPLHAAAPTPAPQCPVPAAPCETCPQPAPPKLDGPALPAPCPQPNDGARDQRPLTPVPDRLPEPVPPRSDNATSA